MHLAALLLACLAAAAFPLAGPALALEDAALPQASAKAASVTGSNAAVQELTAQVTSYLPAEMVAAERAEVRASLAPSYLCQHEGSEVRLTLDDFTVEPHYRIEEQQVERTLDFPDQPCPDVLQLPLDMAFELLDGVSPGSRSMVSLHYTAVQWRQTASDADGRPLSYEGHVTYRGVERQLVPDYLEVQATYRGTVPVSQEEPAVQPVAVQPSPAVPAPRPAAIPATHAATTQPQPQTQAPWPMAAVAAAAARVLLAGLGLAVLLARRNNIRLVAEDGSGKVRTALRRSVRLVDGQAVLKVPARIPLLDPEQRYSLLIKEGLAASPGSLDVIWRGRLLSRSPLSRRLDLSCGLSQATEGAARLA